MEAEAASGREAPNLVAIVAGMVLVALVIGRFGGPVGDWVGAIGTATHEAGHALVADVLAGDVISITVFRDGGGVAVTEASGSGWRTFLVSAAGYPATLLAALALLTAVLFGRSSRTIAAAGAVAALVALVFWTPFNAAIDAVDDGDQRFTWFVLLVSALLMAGAAAIPDRHDTVRRVVLGAFAIGLLSDAFRAGEDLVVIEGRAGETLTDADGMAEAAGVLGSTAWAWILRLSLFAIAAAWAWVVVRRWRPADLSASD